MIGLDGDTLRKLDSDIAETAQNISANYGAIVQNADSYADTEEWKIFSGIATEIVNEINKLADNVNKGVTDRLRIIEEYNATKFDFTV